VSSSSSTEAMTLALAEEDLPELFRSADAVAKRAERRYMRTSAAQLLLVVAAAGFAKISLESDSGLNLGQLAAAAAFLVAFVTRSAMVSSSHDRLWFQARAAAESTKTLAWRYAMGGEPFRVDLVGDKEADRLFIERMRAILDVLRQFPIVPSTDRTDQITAGMRRLRSSPLEARRAAFYEGRILNQQRWYIGKARWNERRARLWNGVMLTFEAGGAVFALLVGTGVIGFELASFSATIVGAAAAWMNTKQHRTLATSYSIAAHELSEFQALASNGTNEESWAEFVDQVEQAISREHTLWNPSRRV
jgi:conflict system pore-forming effector with SLATT domain